MSDRVEAFRRLVFAGVKRALEIDGHCKPYEGAIVVHYPSYFANQGAGIISQPTHNYRVELHCYVLGPDRHYEWEDDTLDKVLSRAEVDVRTWIAEMIAEDSGKPMTHAESNRFRAELSK